jgi:hypothetical protein
MLRGAGYVSITPTVHPGERSAGFTSITATT